MLISSPEQWSVVTAPVRFEILEAMRDLAPCGIKAIARQLGVKPDTLYRHMDLLQQAGFVVPAGFRKVPRANEQLFDLTADDFHISFDTDADPGPANDMIRDTGVMMFKRMVSAVKRAAAARAFRTTPGNANVVLLNDFAHLTRKELGEIRSLLKKMKQIVDSTRGRAGCDPTTFYSVLIAAIPVTPRTRGKRKNKKLKGKPTLSKEPV
jgi:hypothetical protein